VRALVIGEALIDVVLRNGRVAGEHVGGSPLNGAWLLGNAQAQNDHKDPDAIDRSALSGSELVMVLSFRANRAPTSR
jgi:curli production assembly/transport component CsgF